MGWLEFELSEERRRSLLREAERGRLLRKVREGRRRLSGKERDGKLAGIEVRWGVPEDGPGIARLLELNGVPPWVAFEERFIVAEEGGELLAALTYRRESGRVLTGRLVVDPWAGERRLAVALYAGAGWLARESGVEEVVAQPVAHADYPLEAGYRRWGRRLRLHVGEPGDAESALPTGLWRRSAALFRAVHVPLFRAFRA